MEKDKLSSLAKVSAIIACIVAVLGYFNIYPSCSRQDKGDHIEVIKEKKADETKNANIVPEQTLTYENEIAEEPIIPNKDVASKEYEAEYKTWEEMSSWDTFKLPFIKHKRMNYFKNYIWKEFGWTVFLILICWYPLLLLPYAVKETVKDLIDDKKEGKSILSHIIGLILLMAIIIYLFLEVLVLFGAY